MDKQTVDKHEEVVSLTRPLVERLPALARDHRVPGAQLAFRYGGAVTATEFGVLEFGTSRQVSPDTVFPVGSITKCFTATVAMILGADGDVDLDEPIGDYLPELDELGNTLTLRHLLSHTSGLPSAPGAGAAAPTLRRFAEHIHSGDMVLAPGSGFSYSNAGYSLVGLLIESITGMSWAEALDTILLRPLGIEPAITGLPTARAIATGHSVNPHTGRVRPVQQSRTPADVPAGALSVSALDLARLGSLHLAPGDPSVLPGSQAELMRRAVPGANPFGLADGWGLGLAVYRHASTTWVGHDGNADGTACFVRVAPADGWAIALTTNASTGGALWQDLLAEMAPAGIPIGPTATPGALPAMPAPPGCAGRYINGELDYLVTAEPGGTVFLSVEGEAPAPLNCHADLSFSMTDPATGRVALGGRFVLEADTGNVAGILIGGRFARLRPLASQGASSLWTLNASSAS